MSDDRFQDQPVGDEPQPDKAPIDDPVEEAATTPPIADEHWEAALAAWIDRLRGGPIAQVTEAWNQLMREAPKLRDLLHKEMKGS